MTTFERNHTAKAIKEIRKILRGSEPVKEPYCTCSFCELNDQERSIVTHSPWLAFWVSLVFWLCLFASCLHTPAHAYTNEQYVNAIRHAEGTWTYGIKTVKCTNEASCRRIALQTVRNNRIRFAKYGFRHYPSFTQFLGSRYCPTIGRNRTPSEIRLNQYWVKNVSFYLAR